MLDYCFARYELENLSNYTIKQYKIYKENCNNDEKLGEDGLLKLMENQENRNACFMEAFAYCEYGKEPIVFKSVTKGTIAREKSGTYVWSWDYIFIPEGKDITMGNFPDDERCLVWNTDAYHELASFLKNKED